MFPFRYFYGFIYLITRHTYAERLQTSAKGLHTSTEDFHTEGLHTSTESPYTSNESPHTYADGLTFVSVSGSLDA